MKEIEFLGRAVGQAPTLEDLRSQLAAQLDIQHFEDIAYSVHKIECEYDAKHALSMALQTRKLENTLEKGRIDLTKPHVDYQKSINKLVKEFNAKLEAIQDRLQVKLEEWIDSQKDDPYTKIEGIEVEDGSLFLKQRWDFDVEDELDAKIPREYLTVNDTAIKWAINNGVRNIPGITIFSVQETHMRVKN